MSFVPENFEEQKRRAREGDKYYLEELIHVAYFMAFESFEKGYGKPPSTQELPKIDILAKKNPLLLIDTIERTDLDPSILERLLSFENLRPPKKPNLRPHGYSGTHAEIANKFYEDINARIFVHQLQKGGYEEEPIVEIMLHPNMKTSGLTGQVEGRWRGHSIDALVADYHVDPNGKVKFSNKVFEEYK